MDLSPLLSRLLQPRNIPVSLDEIRVLREVADGITESKKPSKKTLELSPTYEIDGCIGQYAVSKRLGVPYDDKIFVGGDLGVDIEWAGLKLQVKSTRYAISPDGEMPHLINFTDVEPTSSLYILMIVRNNAATFAGWLLRDQLATRGYRRGGFPPDYKGDRDRWVVPLRDLNDSIYYDFFPK